MMNTMILTIMIVMEIIMILNNSMDFILGCAASLAIWLLTTIILTPKVKVCKQIAKEVVGANSTYRLKILNKAFFRDAYGIVIYIRILYKNTYLTIKAPEVPVLYSKCHSTPKYSNERFIPINLMAIRRQKIKGFNDSNLLKKYDSGVLQIEDFIENDTGFEVVLIANDKFSGARVCVVAIQYDSEKLKDAIVEGYYEDGKERIKMPQRPKTANE